MSNDHQPQRAATNFPSPLAWLVALAGPVIVAAVLVPLRDSIRTSNVSLVLALPVCGAGRSFGRFVIDLETGGGGISVPPEDRALALALADQLGKVLANEVRS